MNGKVQAINVGTIDLPSFLSNFTVKLNAAEKPEQCIEELKEASQNFFSIDWYAYILEGKFYGRELSPHILEFASWSSQKRKISIIPINGSSILFIPLFSRKKDIGIFIAEIKNDPDDVKMGAIDIESFIAFETSMIVENMILTTELVRKNEYVSEAKNYLENVLNSLNYAVIVLDMYKGEEFSNEPYKKLHEKNEEIKEHIENAAKESLTYRKELSNEIEVNGDFYSIHVVPVTLSSGLKIVASVQDITNTKELERLQKIDKMKDNFVAVVSHELKTPLSAILAYSETLIGSIDSIDKGTLEEFAKTIKSEAEHLSSIIEDMINFSKMSSNNLSMTFGRVDLVKIMKDAYDGFKMQASSNGVKFILNLKDDLPNAYVTADPKRIRQCLDNLLSNAFKYNDSKTPEVVMSAEAVNEGYILSIYDNGSPIPEEERGKIFDKFFRGSNSSSVSGTGLGLAISKEIIELHRGKIWVEGNSNCTFSIFLPKKDWLNAVKEK
jgi:two-component system OmpR family sensor kinase